MREMTQPELHTCDEDRCIEVQGPVQCKFKRVPGREVCPRHALGNQRKEDIFLELDASEYHRALAQRILDSRNSQNLDDEVGTLMVTLERTLTKCTDDTSLLIHAKEISDLVNSIEKLKKSNLAMKKELGQLMSEAQAKEFTAKIFNILVDEVSALGPELSTPLLEKVADRFRDAITK